MLAMAFLLLPLQPHTIKAALARFSTSAQVTKSKSSNGLSLSSIGMSKAGSVMEWNVIIKGYVSKGLFNEVLAFFKEMLKAGLRADSFTLPCALKACAALSRLQHGKSIHSYLVRSKTVGSCVFVGCALVDMYAKCGRIEDARQVFDKMSEKDVISWNALIVGYAQNGRCDMTCKCFCEMQSQGVKPDFVSTASVLKASAHLESLNLGRQVHGFLVTSGYEKDAFMGSALTHMYSKCGRLVEARLAFDQMSHRNRDVVSWNAIIVGYAQNKHHDNVLELFQEMQLAGLKPNLVTIASVLRACAHFSTLQQGKEIHGFVIRNEFEADHFVGSTLIDMYSKCYCISDACQVFDRLPERDVVSWSAMIAGHSQNGNCLDALYLFKDMNICGMEPDSVTIACVLPACARIASLQHGCKTSL